MTDTKHAVLDLIRSFCQRPDLPAEVVDDDVFYDGLTIVVSRSGGVALVSVVENGEDWFLTVSSGAAIDVPDISGALYWANAQNRRVGSGVTTVRSRPTGGWPRLSTGVHPGSLPGHDEPEFPQPCSDCGLQHARRRSWSRPPAGG